MIELGMLAPQTRLSSRELSLKTGVPKAFLHKITADLVKANLLLTFAGPSGGIMLQKPLVEINMLQILEAVEGPICLNICVLNPDECNRQAICPAHDFWNLLQDDLVTKLRGMTLDKLVVDAHVLKKNPRPIPTASLFVSKNDIVVNKRKED
ncbi:MAG: Rrf2 family transcriptional regulator [Chloroflexi bacterium]|nr:Rrf2 family transcriptional regulator [Chloroflexota bacterium]